VQVAIFSSALERNLEIPIAGSVIASVFKVFEADGYWLTGDRTEEASLPLDNFSRRARRAIELDGGQKM